MKRLTKEEFNEIREAFLNSDFLNPDYRIICSGDTVMQSSSFSENTDSSILEMKRNTTASKEIDGRIRFMEIGQDSVLKGADWILNSLSDVSDLTVVASGMTIEIEVKERQMPYDTDFMKEKGILIEKRKIDEWIASGKFKKVLYSTVTPDNQIITHYPYRLMQNGTFRKITYSCPNMDFKSDIWYRKDKECYIFPFETRVTDLSTI